MAYDATLFLYAQACRKIGLTRKCTTYIIQLKVYYASNTV